MVFYTFTVLDKPCSKSYSRTLLTTAEGNIDKTLEVLKTGPSQKELLEVFDYNPFTGILTWRVSTGPRAVVGEEAGYVDVNYRKVEVFGQRYLVHRIIWCMVHGVWPDFFIDHENLNKYDNRLSNLRPASRGENNHNRGLLVNNTSGVKGVSWHRQKQQWYARVAYKKVTVFAKMFDLLQDAENAVRFVRQQIHKEYANHG